MTLMLIVFFSLEIKKMLIIIYTSNMCWLKRQIAAKVSKNT